MDLPYLHSLYVDYFAYFNGNQDYFECHEVLEEYWKEIAPGDKNHVLVGLVQLATGMYHWRRDNRSGALRMLQKSFANLQQHTKSEFLQALDVEQLFQDVEHVLTHIKSGDSFTAFPIIIQDEALQQLIDKKLLALPRVEAHFLHNKHMLRDRSEVLEARAQKMAEKQQRGI